MGANLTHTRVFDDGSSIMYYDNGYIRISHKPCKMCETSEQPKIPTARLYYWQVMMNRPDVTTWEDIRKADKE
jgi:hypothetical protein